MSAQPFDEHDGPVDDLHHDLPPDLSEAPLPDGQVERAIRVVRLTGLVPFFEDRLCPVPVRRPDGTVHSKGGRPRTAITVEALLVAMLLAAVEGKAMHVKTWSVLMHRRLSPAMRARLGVVREVPDSLDGSASAAPHVKTDDRHDRLAARKQVERLFHALIAPIDPSPLPKNKVLTKAELEKVAKPLTAAQVAERQDLLDWVTGRILEATFLLLPRPVRRAWKGSVGHDATYVGTWARGRAKKSKWASTDPDAGHYVRQGDHQAPDDIGGRYHKDGTPKSKFGYDCEIAVMGADDPDDARRFPYLAMGIRLHKPGFAPGPNCIAVLADIGRRHVLANPVTGQALFTGHPDGQTPNKHPTNFLGADRAYNGSVPRGWVLPAKALGYDPVFDYKDKDLGHQATHEGAVLVDGTWYSPSIMRYPDKVNATRDYLAGRIDTDRHTSLIKTREDHALRAVERKTDEHGNPTGVVKYACQAAGRPGKSLRPTVLCDLKPASLLPAGTIDGRPPMLLPLLVANETRGAVCTQQTITIGPETHPKHQQSLAHLSPRWNGVYGTLRNTIESTNGTAKDTSKTPIEQGDRRRIRGLAATSVLVAFLLAARNLLKITNWNANTDWNGDGSMTDTRPKPSRTKRPALDDFHPRHTARKAKQAALLAAAKTPPVPPTPGGTPPPATEPPPTRTKAQARARQRALGSRPENKN